MLVSQWRVKSQARRLKRILKGKKLFSFIGVEAKKKKKTFLDATIENWFEIEKVSQRTNLQHTYIHNTNVLLHGVFVDYKIEFINK
jgi:hypothetical protein